MYTSYVDSIHRKPVRGLLKFSCFLIISLIYLCCDLKYNTSLIVNDIVFNITNNRSHYIVIDPVTNDLIH